MSSTGVRDSNSNDRRIIKGLIQNEAQFIQSLRVFANTSTLSGLGATEGDSNNSPSEPSGNYFAKSGDILLGQFGNSFEITTIANGQLNISKGIGFTSPLLIVNPQGGAPDFLDKLIGGTDVFPYQEQLLQIVSQNITIRPQLSLTITNIVGNGVDNIITVTVASTAALVTGDKVDISNTTNFNVGDATIIVTGGTTFTYNLGSTGSATPEASGDVDRGNFKLPDDTEFVAAPNTIIHAIFNTVTQLWDFGTEISISGEAGGDVFLANDQTFTGINTFTGTTFNVQTDAINLGDSIADSINFLGRAGTDLVPIANSTHSLGISGLQWNNLWVDTLRNASTVVIASPNFAINSSQITLGDATTDTITFLGRIGSNAIIPIADATTDLGTSALAFDTLYVDIINNASAVNIASPTFTINSATINIGDATTDTINFLGRVGNLGIIPINDSIATLGTSGKRWDTLWVDTITSAATVAIASPNFAINSSQITLGDSTSDDINFLGRVATDIDPDFDAIRSMGSSALEWNQIFVRILNATSTLAVVSPNFSVNSSQITLGDSTTDDVNILGRLNTDVDPSSDNNIDFGSSSLTYGFSFFKGGHAIVEGYSTGFKPTGQTNTGILFTVPTAGGKTELRSCFQTGPSQIIVTEP